MTLKKRIATLLLSFLLLFVIGGESILSAFGITASAETVEYSNVLDDLQKDEKFDAADYPILTVDYVNGVNADNDTENDQALMEVIQIAETTSDELFIYVYQPTNSELDLTATGVLLSTEFTPDGQNINPEIFYLELVSTDSVFDKYVVKDFNVSEESYRYYNIVTLYRNFNPTIDEVTEGGVVENFEIGIGVGQQWCVYYQNNQVVYEMNTFETVELDIGYTGSVNFSSGFTFNSIHGSFESGDLWFISFNVEDYIVDKIFDADLVYKIRTKEHIFGTGIDETTYGDWSEDIPVTLKNEDTATYEGAGIFAREYKWNTISKSDDFITQLENQDVIISDEMRNALSENDWIFAFLQTERTTNMYGYNQTTWSSNVSAVTVIRLHFMDITGQVYNLGVVSDRVSPDDIPDAYGNGIDPEFFDWFKFLVFVVVCIFLWNPISALVKFVFNGLKTLFDWCMKIIYAIVSAPFRFIGWLLKNKQK